MKRKFSTIIGIPIAWIAMFYCSNPQANAQIFDEDSPAVREFKLLLSGGRRRPDNLSEQVLEKSRGVANGGGYDKKFEGQGVPADVVFKGRTILSRTKSLKGSYCSGFTFWVAMEAIQASGAFDGRNVQEVRDFQQLWYGNTEESKEKCAIYAMEQAGIGSEVPLADAKPGDIGQFWRPSNGHSIVFLEWVKSGEQTVGIRYRSSQHKTNGVGDATEYFADATPNGTIDRKRTYFGRLHAGPASQDP